MFFRNEYFFLSNFYNSDIEIDGIIYKNGEAAFQAQKCKTNEEKKRFAQMDGKSAKAAGRRVNMRSDWEIVKKDMMRKVIFSKFSQNPYLKKKLIATGDMLIEETNSWGDTTWGVCNGVGKNWLGEILMEVRAELKNR